MTLQTTTSVDAGQGFILPTNKRDFTSIKLQMVIGAMLITAVCILNYLPSLHIGLLLDDFNNVDYAFRAMHGDPADFLANFYSNWAQLDVMKSYRPFISLSFFTDYLLWGLNYVGFHVTNVVMFTGCAIFVSLIALELTGMYGNRSRASVAIWAGLLFAADPLHVESVTWIIGRVDLLCSLFYFASVFCFMRFRLLRERMYLVLSLVFFFIALGSKEMAVTLPLVQTLVCLLPIKKTPRTNETAIQKLLSSDLKFALLFWIELAGFSVMRLAFLGSAIGGYGSTDAKTVLNSWRNFADRSTIYKIFVPVNEELHFDPKFIQVCWAGFGMILATSLVRLCQSRKLLTPLSFLILWAVLAVLPTFQIWHIYPNLVGSRLFFTSSAPFCIALALCAIPSTDAMSRFATKIWTYFGAVALIIVFVCWSFVLQENLKPWQTAATQMQTFRQQLTALASELAPGQRALLLNLPPDYQGAGMVTRAWYVEQICRPPFAAHDTSNKFISIEPVVSGSHDFIWPGELEHLLGDKTIAKKVIWNPAQGTFEPFTKRSTQSPNIVTINNFLGATIEPADAWTSLEKEWRLQTDHQPGMEIHKDFRRLYPAKTSVKKGAPPVMTFWLPAHDINPLTQNYARLNMKLHGSEADLDRCRFVWKSKGLNLPGQIEHEAMIQRNSNDTYYVWLGRYRGWCLNDAPTAVGLRLPAGVYCVDLKSIELRPDSPYKPTLSLEGSEPSYPTPATAIRPKSQGAKIHWQAKMPLVASVVLRVSKPNLVFDPNSELELVTKSFAYTTLANGLSVLTGPPGNLAEEIPRSEIVGSIALSELKLHEGTTQVQVIGKDKYGAPVGLASEPISIKLPSARDK
jgi:hypothetical protein